MGGGMMIIVIHTIVVDTTEILSGVHQEGPKKNTRREEEGPVQSCEAAIGTVTGTVTATGVVIEIDNENMIVHVNVIEIVEEGDEVGHAHRLDLVLVANLAVVVTTAATIALMNIVVLQAKVAVAVDRGVILLKMIMMEASVRIIKNHL